MMLLWRLPSILLIQLKRFRNILSGDRKLTKLIEYPIAGLDLSKYTLGIRQDCVYDLFGVVHHRGFISGGHYIAFANTAPGSEDGKNRAIMCVTIVAHTVEPVNNGHYRTNVVAIHRLI